LHRPRNHQRLEAETKSAGGIVIPDTAAEKPIKGEVVAVGAGKILDDGKVRRSRSRRDKVLFGQVFRHRGQGRWRGTARHARRDLVAIIEG